MARPRKSYYWWIAGKILYGLLGLAIFVMVAFLLWRVYFSGKIPKEVKGVVSNERLVALYAEKGEDIELLTQEQATVTKGEENYGYFSVPQFVYIPEISQVQVLFRYNNSTLKYTQRDFELAERPARGTEVFDVSLVTITDQTPDDPTDNKDGSESLAKTRTAPTSHTVTTTALYTYFVYTFDDVTVKDDTLVLYFDIYYGEAVDYEATPYGTLRLYHFESEWLSRKLTKDEASALSGRQE
ncbi:MAG: hypothetical protein E7650_02135 [Ruminococcaceae bacterium]|nr:hypothetical protein [Oscillospiraceae bacterium]